jgi:hypothetical protein
MKKSKKIEKIIGASLVDIPSNAKDRLEIVLEASGAGGSIVGRKEISIGLDDGEGHLSLTEAKKLSEIILKMSRPKFERTFGDCYYYQVTLFVSGKQYALVVPDGGEDENAWKLIPFDETPLPF